MNPSTDLNHARAKLQYMEEHINWIWSQPKKTANTVEKIEVPFHRESILDRIARFFSNRG